MNKTIASVIDDINEWENPRGGSVFYVTAIFTDESVGSVGRKDHDAALEVQGLLREAIGQPQDFVLEPAGLTKTGRDKFKIKGFGTPGGAATYTAPGVQGGGGSPDGLRGVPRRSPEHDYYIQERMDRRTALMQAVAITNGRAFADAIVYANEFYIWLRETSEPASSAYDIPSTETSATSHQAGAGSETTSPVGPNDARTESLQSALTPGTAQSAVSAADGGVGVGEGTCPPPRS